MPRVVGAPRRREFPNPAEMARIVRRTSSRMPIRMRDRAVAIDGLL
jgi:hypothetical protein